MRLRNCLLVSALVVILLFSAGCQENEVSADEEKFVQNTDVTANNDQAEKYYTLEDFEDIIIGQSSYEDLKKHVGFPTDPPVCTALGSGDVVLAYPAGNNQFIYVRYDPINSVIINIEMA